MSTRSEYDMAVYGGALAFRSWDNGRVDTLFLYYESGAACFIEGD